MIPLLVSLNARPQADMIVQLRTSNLNILDQQTWISRLKTGINLNLSGLMPIRLNSKENAKH